MKITTEWLASIQDEQGLTKGQQRLLAIWKARQGFAGFDYLPDQVANFLEGCIGYRCKPAILQDMM